MRSIFLYAYDFTTHIVIMGRYTYKAMSATVILYLHVDSYKDFYAKSTFLRLAHP